MIKPLISIIVPVYNNVATIERCLDSLESQTWPNIEVIMVDDASCDGSLQLLEALAKSRSCLRVYSLAARSGAAAARNLGFKNAKGEILALIDGDMWAPQDWLELLVQPLFAGIAEVTGGPDRVPKDSSLVSRCIGYSMDSLLTSGGLRLGSTKLVRYLPGTGNMAIASGVVRNAGVFNEEFHDTGEDKEWLHRVRESGARMLYLEQALAWHERKPDLLLHAKKQLLSGRRRFDIALNSPGSFEWPHFAPAALVAFLLVGGYSPELRILWLGVIAIIAFVLLCDSFYGAWKLGDPRALPILLFSLATIPLGYGLGTLLRGLELAFLRKSNR